MAVPSWSDIFSSLKPYEDPNEVDAFDFEEVGDPRFGIVQVIIPYFNNGILCLIINVRFRKLLDGVIPKYRI
jgi:hypothetical protein